MFTFFLSHKNVKKYQAFINTSKLSKNNLNNTIKNKAMSLEQYISETQNTRYTQIPFVRFYVDTSIIQELHKTF